MLNRTLRRLAGSFGLLVASFAFAPAAAPAGQPSTQYGIVEHVSSTNLKIQDPKTGRTYTFLTTPQINKIGGGSPATKQQAVLHAGQYVQVLYSRVLGVMKARHVKVLDNANGVYKKVGT